MDVPAMDTNIDLDDIQRVVWQKEQLIAIQAKHIAKLEALLREKPAATDLAAQKDLEQPLPALDGKKG